MFRLHERFWSFEPRTGRGRSQQTKTKRETYGYPKITSTDHDGKTEAPNGGEVLPMTTTQEKLIKRTKNFNGLRLSVSGSVQNICSDIENIDLEEALNREPPEIHIDTWGIKEIARLYNEGREAWLKGDFETVADMFGVLV
jgi:hypothetical protein